MAKQTLKLTKELVAELLDEDVLTKKREKEIHALIDEKANRIWHFIAKKLDSEVDWWAYQNDVEYGDGNGSSGGSFDPVGDAEWINIKGEEYLLA